MRSLIVLCLVAVAGCATPRLPDAKIAEATFTVLWLAPDETVMKPLGYMVGGNGQLTEIVVFLPFLGKEEAFVIDTGAATSHLFPDFCSGKGLRFSEKTKVEGLGGASTTFSTVLIPEADMGFAQIKNWRVTVGAVPSLEKNNVKWRQQGKPSIVGLIGADLLAPLGAVINYRTRTITFSRKPNQSLEPTAPSGRGSS